MKGRKLSHNHILIIHYLFTHAIADSWKAIFSKALTRPFKLFALESIVQLLGVYMAFIYGVFYRAFPSMLALVTLFSLIHAFSVFLTTMPMIFAEVYNEEPGIAGLHYIALGIGLTLASQVNARLLDRSYKYFKQKNNGVGEPEFRLRTYSRCWATFNSDIFRSIDGAGDNYPTIRSATSWMVCTAPSTLDRHGHWNCLCRSRDDPDLPSYSDLRR
jgi:hypothetical protein